MKSVPTRLGPPSLLFRGRDFAADELTLLAARWLGELSGDSAPLAAVVMANHPQAVAAFFAASGGTRPLIILPPTPTAWRTEPRVPSGTRLILPPTLAELASAGEACGFQVTLLSEPTDSASAPLSDAPFLTTPGFVLFTSGSTGAPKPVYRTVAQVLGSVTRILDAVSAPRAALIAGTLPLSTTHGLSTLLAASEREGTLGLLEHFEPSAALSLFAAREFDYWPAVPVMADMLTRLVARTPARRWRVPAMCTVAGAPLSEAQWHAFRERYGVALRAIYGSTEVGMVSIEAAPADAIRPGSAGQVAPGIEVRIGEHPGSPLPAGVAGSIWVRSPLFMRGYGYPPRLELPDAIDGWRPMPDRGRLAADRTLSIVGRTDEVFKTRGGYLVEPEAIAAAVAACPGVTDAIVVPVATETGVVAGALVESTTSLRTAELRARLLTALPPWAQPRVIHVITALPRLATGKVDRQRCAAILRELSGRSHA
jgi:acyl-coenzyme A synthetase/AMP-(fatty) acid ligase